MSDISDMEDASRAMMATVPKAVAKVDVGWSHDFIQLLVRDELLITSMFLIFALILRFRGSDMGEILRLTILPLIVCETIFLVLVGYSQTQITMVIGLFGTISGYLLHPNKKSDD